MLVAGPADDVTALFDATRHRRSKSSIADVRLCLCSIAALRGEGLRTVNRAAITKERIFAKTSVRGVPVGLSTHRLSGRICAVPVEYNLKISSIKIIPARDEQHKCCRRYRSRILCKLCRWLFHRKGCLHSSSRGVSTGARYLSHVTSM